MTINAEDIRIFPHAPRTPKFVVDCFLLRTMHSDLDDLLQEAQCVTSDEDIQEMYVRILEIRKLRRALRSIDTSADHPKCAKYVVSSSFLATSLDELTRGPHEQLVYITGPEDGRSFFALTQILRLDMKSSSAAHAVPDQKSQIKVLSALDRRRERLLATFHSHPGYGADATRPSSIDLSTQRNLENAGYPVIGAILSRDGYIRFYSHNRQFSVSVSGAHCKQNSPTLFRLKPPLCPSKKYREVYHHDHIDDVPST
jgi:proteasome lid subunit RPN8/RPN11